MTTHILETLYDILQTRKTAEGERSYVASLYAKGAPKICEKLMEEAGETATESLALEQDPNNSALKTALRQESADLLFHWLVMMAYHDLNPAEVFAVLESRLGVSGHDEKAARTQHSTNEKDKDHV